MADLELPVRGNKKKGRNKKGNKHAKNLRRRERKALRNKQRMENRRVAVPGKCGSSFCTTITGCEPWK